MKHLNLFTTLLCAAVLIIGCEKDEITPGTPEEVIPPVLTPTSEDLSVPAEGGEYAITYTLENPVEGGEIRAAVSSDASGWMSAESQFSGEISLSITANENPAEREGRVTVTYTWPDSTLSFSTKVTQAGMETPGPEYYTITVTDNPNCTVTVTSGGKELSEATEGTLIDLTATPDEGYTFVEWKTEGVNFQMDATSASVRFAMPENDITIEAVVENSELVPHIIKINARCQGGLGEAFAYNEDGQVITEAMIGETITIEASSLSPLWEFASWEIQWGDIVLEDPYASTTTFVMPAENVNIDALYQEVVPDGCLVTVINPRGGTITATDADGNSVDYVIEGTEVFLSIETKTNYTFNGWTLTGAEPKDAGSTQTSFIMPANEVTVTAGLTYEGGDVTDGESVTINGITWATANVDIPGTFAASPQDLGLLYQYNRNIGYSTESPDAAYDANGPITFSWNTSSSESDIWESANDPCPDGYRVPTADELRTLTDAANVDWVYDEAGTTFTDKNTGESMFLPGGIERSGSTGALWNPAWGAYWSADAGTSSTLAYRLYTGEASVSVNQSMRTSGYFVRCILDSNY